MGNIGLSRLFRKRDELFEATDITEYTILGTKGEIEKCWKEARHLESPDLMRECNGKSARGRRQLDAIYKTRLQLLDYNMSRKMSKLQVVLKAMKKNKIALEKLTKAHDDVEEKKMKTVHQKELGRFDVGKRTMIKMYADRLAEATEQVAQFRMMPDAEKMEMREARVKDSMEEEHQKRVANAKLLIAWVVGLKEKLKITAENLKARSCQEFQLAYVNHLLERTRLCLVILEQDVVDLSEGNSKVLKCLEDGKQAIQTITVAEMERGTLDFDAIYSQLQKLVEIIEKLQEIKIPEAKMNHHLRKLLGTQKKSKVLDNFTILLGLLVVALVWIWMNI